MTDKKLMVYLENSQTAIPVTYKLRMLLRRAILETLAYENVDIKSPEVSMTFTDNEGIRELNRAHRDIDRATDVLSFPMYETEELENAIGELALGDIVISLEKANDQAEEYGHSFEREVSFLTVHSMLHLLGYDHLDEGPQKAQMRSREEAIAALIPRMQRD